MDLDQVELARDRATSSEPCSTRPNPFDDVEQSSRKRQRVSSSQSRSHSVDTTPPSTNIEDRRAANTQNPDDEKKPPSHETQFHNSSTMASAEPTSSKVTINLRTSRVDVANTPSSSSTSTASKENDDDAHNMESNAGHMTEGATKQPAETIKIASSSPSAAGSPQVELVVDDDDDPAYRNVSAPIALLRHDGQVVQEETVMEWFPYTSRGENLTATVRKIARFFEFEAVETEEPFCKLREWIIAYLDASSTEESVWYANYEKFRDFWNLLPEIIWALSRRKSYFGQFLARSKTGRRALTDLLVQFAQLTATFIARDAEILSSVRSTGANTEPTIISRPYVAAFAYLLRKEESPHIGRNLEQHYRWNWDEDVSLMMDSFLSAGGSIPTLTALTRNCLDLASQFPKMVDDLTEPCRIVTKAVVDAASILNNTSLLQQQHIEPAQQIIRQGYDYFKVMSQGLTQIIEKHVTFLSADAALSHISGLADILSVSLNLEACPARELVEQHRQHHPDLPATYTPTVISTEWKFDILRRLIVSGQMQLRVSGVTTLCQELLAIFTKHKKEDTANHPLLLYLARLILQDQLIDYIVGIDSHREIICESGNIVGFLVATKTYTMAQTDTIWKTVMTSPDPRVVEAILRMLGQILNLYDYDGLLYLCKKVGELPLEAFTIPMREYFERLLSLLVLRATNNKPEFVAALPYEICLRLMQDASIPSSGNPLGAVDIQTYAAARLRDLMAHGPPSDVRNELYISCINDITERSPTSSGSICALYFLLHRNMPDDLHVLTTNHGLTRLLIEEFDRVNKADAAASISPSLRSPVRQARRDLLLAIILHESSTITTELGERLWSILVGTDARDYTDREIGWQILNSAAKKTSSKNAFIATCFREYLPTLEAQYYTLGSLDFAREAIQASLHEAQGDLLDDENANSQDIGHLWRMILNAPPDTIEAPAINTLVELYVDSPVVLTMPRQRAHRLHLSIVHRCLKQLSSAARNLRAFNDGTTSGDDEPMVIVVSEEKVHQQEFIFTRSLLLLREFLRVYQTKPHFASAKPRPPVVGVIGEIRGDILDLKYQSFDGDKSDGVKILRLGKLNTVADFLATIQNVTGFKECKVYHWGKEVPSSGSDMEASIEESQIAKGLVLVVRHNVEENPDSQVTDANTLPSLESEIVNHFDDFWEYLGMEEKLSREIYYFLVKFPVYHKLLKAFDDETAMSSAIFPLSQPFKCLYAVYALREHLSIRAREGKVDDPTLSRAISLVVFGITNEEILNRCADLDLKQHLAQALIDCLILLLPEPIPESSMMENINSALLSRLLQLMRDAKAEAGPQNVVHLITVTFEAILEASLRSPQFWRAFISDSNTPRLLTELLLEDPRPVLRKSIMKQITAKCSFTPSLSSLSAIDIAIALWPSLKDMVPKAISQPSQCEEVLTVTLLVFRKLADTSIESVNLEECLLSWGSLLVTHTPTEEVGSPEQVDTVGRGLGNLLYWCTSFMKASSQQVLSNGLAVALFRQHLFPDLSDENSTGRVSERVPLLNTATRKLIADTIIYLTRDDREQYMEILHILNALVPYDGDEDIPYAFDMAFGFDRTKAIRSPTGYLGLRNLSNTCYLNSLFTQLFMNVTFRRFMLDVNVADGSSQKLLFETQKLFAFMQNSFKRFIEPSTLANSIRTYDDTNIDVNIQMDVDEFYNLLFDRWEGQILSTDDKHKFRSFYGGHLVQQVKSTECVHNSSRTEQFSAIQCDIKGKSTLQESLQAYVGGEVMEGDNKYKCSDCDRHVNAVKRACLKDIPDNLIFHLKRFDFNLRTMQRSKINDYFSFPHKIDMTPYKVESLMEPPKEMPEDMFELVGILVHSGTAESGHYYSYIRERPSADLAPTWVEFNDDHVTPFDPSCIEANCFGGVEPRGPESGSFSFDKTWSAYMLFYQRSSLLQDERNGMISSGNSQPLRLPLEPRLRNFIASENELFIRKYCLYDESHCSFVLRMLDNLHTWNRGQCSEEHEVEKLALSTVLLHLDQVVSRTKDLPDFGPYMLTLSHRLQTCAECCRDFLEWLIDHAEAFRQLLFRSPDYIVRSEIVKAVLLALSRVKNHSSFDYGLSDEVNEDMGAENYESPRLFPRLLDTLDKFWDTFHLSTRAWPEYFGLLGNIAQFGMEESAAMLDAKVLVKVLEILTADSSSPSSAQYARMLTIINKRPLNKPVQLDNVIALLEILLRSCDFSVEPLPDYEGRIDFVADDGVPLIELERSLIEQHWTRGNINILVEKLLTYGQNEKSTLRIIKLLLNTELGGVHRGIFNAVRTCIRKGNTSTSSFMALRAALVYCQHTHDLEGLSRIIEHVANVTRSSINNEGREYLRFFRDLSSLQPRNLDVDRREYFAFVIDQIPIWAPSLLVYHDPLVRTDTEDYIRQDLISNLTDQDTNASELEQVDQQTIMQVIRNLGLSSLKFLDEEYVKPRQQVVKAMLVNMMTVIDLCKSFHDEGSEDSQNDQFNDVYGEVLPALKRLIVEEVDEDASEWENSDDAFSSSGVLEDLVGDLNDADV